MRIAAFLFFFSRPPDVVAVLHFRYAKAKHFFHANTHSALVPGGPDRFLSAKDAAAGH
jgi:hypothetical protein